MQKKTNIELIEEEILKAGLEVGSIDIDVNDLTKKAIKQIIENLTSESDQFVTIRNKLFVIEMPICDNELDIVVFTGYEYFSRYGNLEDALEFEKITEEQYNKLKSQGL